jgi:hypothetical protein
MMKISPSKKRRIGGLFARWAKSISVVHLADLTTLQHDSRIPVFSIILQ